MSMQRYLGQVFEQLSDDEVAGIAISAGVKRDGNAWEPAGVDLTAFKQNPVILRAHNPEWVIGTATAIGLTDGGKSIAIKIQFAPPGVSAVADEARGLAKAGILQGISAGVNPLEVEPLRDGTGGMRVVSSELLEVSLVACPADSDALITARHFKSRAGTAAMLRALPAISRSAIDRALDQAGRAGHKPIGLMNVYERTAFYAEEQRRRTMACWAIGQANEAERTERERDFSYAQRQADLRRLTDESTH